MKCFNPLISIFLGFLKYSSSTLSNGKVSCPKSYNNPSTSNWIGVSGKNGRIMLAIITDITSPKLKLAASLIYFIKFANVWRPSFTPSNKTCKSFSRRIISADSFAISTAVSTDTPTSEFISDGLSLIPSPIYPTIFPASFRSLTTRAFWIGESFANILVLFKSLFTAWSDSLSRSEPMTIWGDFIPTLSHTHFVTSTLSPVKTITLIPFLFNFSIEDLALSFGGSRNPINPIRTIFFSSSTPKSDVLFKSFFWQIATTRRPCLFKSFVIFFIFSLISFVIGEILPW